MIGLLNILAAGLVMILFMRDLRIRKEINLIAGLIAALNLFCGIYNIMSSS